MAEGAKYIFIKSQNGLGDRIITLASALYYAKKTGRRVLVDWSDDMYSDGRGEAFSQLFRIKAPGRFGDLSAVLAGAHSVAPPIWDGHLDRYHFKLLDEVNDSVFDKDIALREHQIDLNEDYDEDVVVLWAPEQMMSNLPCPIRELPTEQSQRLALCAELLGEAVEPAPDIQEAVLDFRAQSGEGPWIGVHIRASNEGHTRHVPLEYYLTLIRAYQRWHPEAIVFVVTDNEESLRQVQAAVPGVVAYPKWFPPVGEAMHYGDDRPDPLAIAREALIEICALSECEVILAPIYSCFSFVSTMRQMQRGGGLTYRLPGRGLKKPWPLSTLKSIRDRARFAKEFNARLDAAGL